MPISDVSDSLISAPGSSGALFRHFVDLRDRTHGGARSRAEKERLFRRAVALLDPYARQVLEELNADLLLGAGEVSATGIQGFAARDLEARWNLSWPDQRAAGVTGVVIRAYFGASFAHPHLQSGTVGDWPLNVFDEREAAAEVPTLRAMAAADLHNLVFKLGGDVRVIPAVARP